MKYCYPELAFLAEHARKKHSVVWGDGGPSHGDPGGPYVKSHCSCVTVDIFTAPKIDESKPCDCGARPHNVLVDRAVRKLQEQLPK